MSVSTQIIRYLVSLVSRVHLCSNRIFLASIGKPILASAASIGHQAADTGTLGDVGGDERTHTSPARRRRPGRTSGRAPAMWPRRCSGAVSKSFGITRKCARNTCWS